MSILRATPALILPLLLVSMAARAELREEANVLSPDGRLAAVLLVQPRAPGMEERARLEIRDRRDGMLRPVVVPPARSTRIQDSFARVRNPVFAADGEAVYLLADTGQVPASVVQRVDLKTGQVRFVIDGTSNDVIRSGRWRGCLLVWRAVDGINRADVVRSDGTVVLTIPGSETVDGQREVARWLKAEHATLG